MRWLLLTAALAAVGSAFAADPVRIAVRPTPTGTGRIVTIGEAARLLGGPPDVREKMAALDLIERPDVEGISRKLIRYRLMLAGYADSEFEFGVAAPGNGQLLSADAVEETAKQELIRRLGVPADDLFVDVVQPVVVKMPAVTADDVVELSAIPNGGAVKLGRTQMNVTVTVNGQRRLSLPVYLQAATAQPVSVAAATEPAADEVVVKARQRVTMTCTNGDLKVTAIGEAMQDGKVGQSIRVQNMDSKKVVLGTVSGPGAIDIILGDDR